MSTQAHADDYRASEYRVEKARAAAVLTLRDGATVQGHFFVSGSSATHDGPERIKDVLNAEPGFFPFAVAEGGSISTALYNRDHILFVVLANGAEPQLEPGYALAARQEVSMLLSNGTRLFGSVRIFRPHGRDRLSDYTRIDERFRYLETREAALVINMRHVVELREI